MRSFRIMGILSLLVALCLSISPVQADSPSPGVLEIEAEAEQISTDIPVAEGFIGEYTAYTLYETKATLAKKAQSECVAPSLALDKCCSPGGACCTCDGCEADGDGCSCPKGKS